MDLKSLALQTDCICHRFNGEVLSRKDYLVIRTPSNPGFFWGNLLVFPDGPKPGDLIRWQALFNQEFSDLPVSHMTFVWDRPDGQEGHVQDFIGAGFRLERSVVLTTEIMHPSRKHNPAIEVRRLSSDEDWESATQNQILCRGDGFDPKEYEKFKRPQMLRYREMSRQGLGDWYGAFLGNRLVGDLGLFRTSQLGRYQSVGTHPEFRRQGVCGTLVYEVGAKALKSGWVKRLVIAADEDYHATQVYEGLGFKRAEKLVGLCRYKG